MGIFERIFGHREKPTMQRTTVDRPFCIERPQIGFLNLLGQAGEVLAEADRLVLAPLFAVAKVQTATAPAFRCEVLFIYCIIDDAGRIGSTHVGLRDLIKSSGAYVAVV